VYEVVAPDGRGRVVTVGIEGEGGTSWIVERRGARPRISISLSHLAWRRAPTQVQKEV
jgi:hypothetical protein